MSKWRQHAKPSRPKPSEYGPPWWDVSKRNSSRNRAAMQKGIHYMSDWKAESRFLNRSNALHAALAAETRKVRRMLKSAIPYGKDSTDGHFRNQIEMRNAPRGNAFSDRDGFQVFTRNQRFLFANAKSGSRKLKTRWSDRALVRASKGRTYGWGVE